eukprot:13202556-Ditylum_brightwellii.AAC.1
MKEFSKVLDLISTGGGLKAGIDYIYLLGQLNVVASTVPIHKEHHCEVGLELNKSKTACYIVKQHRTNGDRVLLGAMKE